MRETTENKSAHFRLQEVKDGIYFAEAIPGSGTMVDLELIQSYFPALEELARTALAQGLTVEDAVKRDLPMPFTEWAVKQVMEWNLRYLFDDMTGNLLAGG
jgi:hypothetical protein